MPALQKNLVIEQGATFTFGFTWCEPLVDGNGDPILDENGELQPGDPHDLTGWTGRLQIRKTRDTPVLLEVTTEQGGITINGPAGHVAVKFTDEATATITTKTAKYDLEVESPDGDVYRLLQGAVAIDPNITHEG